MKKGTIRDSDLLLGQYINIRRWQLMGADWNENFWEAQKISLGERVAKLSLDDFDEYIQRTLAWEKRRIARRTPRQIEEQWANTGKRKQEA